MVSPVIFVPPVLSALLGAVAIKIVDSISNRRSSIAAVHHQLVSNYWRLQGEIQDIHRGEWSEEHTREVRLDAIETVRARSPGVYIDLIEQVDQFPVALSSLEYIRREQIETRRAGAYLEESEESVEERLREIQEVLITVESNFVEYIRANPARRLMFAGVIDEFDPSEPSDTEMQESLPTEITSEL